MGKKNKKPKPNRRGGDDRSPQSPPAPRASKLKLDDHLKDTIIDLLMKIKQTKLEDIPKDDSALAVPPIPPTNANPCGNSSEEEIGSDDSPKQGHVSARRQADARRHFLKNLVKSDNSARQDKKSGGRLKESTGDQSRSALSDKPLSELGAKVRITLCVETVKLGKKSSGKLPKRILGERRAVMIVRSQGLAAVVKEAKNKLKAKGKKLWAFIPDTGEIIPSSGPLLVLDDTLVVVTNREREEDEEEKAETTKQGLEDNQHQGQPIGDTGPEGQVVGDDEGMKQSKDQAENKEEVKSELPEPPSPKRCMLSEIKEAYRKTVGQRDFKMQRTPEEIIAESARLAEHFSTLAEKSSEYRKILNLRSNLPVWEQRIELLDSIATNQVIVVSGETGSGKTTQIPQFVLESMISSGKGGECSIICTQPRRISCIGVSDRVAEEMGELKPGGLVGYQIRLESRVSECTRLRFVTTGTLLRRLIADPTLDGVSHVFVDEVHERDLQTDFLLIILRDLLPRRPDIRLILMSATVQSTLFSDYFGGCPVFHIPGRTFPVTVKFLDQMQFKSTKHNSLREPRKPNHSHKHGVPDERKRSSGIGPPSISPIATESIDYNLVCNVVEYIIVSEEREARQQRQQQDAATEAGAILIFCPGFMEITRLMQELEGRVGRGGGERARIFPLHGSMPSDQQRGIFRRMPEGIWKIVISTNIAETSITIDDVTHVIDTGRVKEMRYDPISRISALREVWISKASATQRSGRAGRVKAGHCWRLYKENFFQQNMPDFTLPEMKRSPLEELILQVLLLELGRPVEFLAKALEPPSPTMIESALLTLVEIEAVKCLGPKMELTPLGYHLAQLPVDARVGKLLLWGCIFQCLDPVLTIAGSLCHKSPLVSPFNKQQEAASSRQEYFAELKSDHLAIVRAYDGWRKIRKNGYQEIRKYCDRRFLSTKSLEMIDALRGQFIRHLKDANFIPRSFDLDKDHDISPRPYISPLVPSEIRSVALYSQDLELVKAVLVGALYPHVAQLVRPENGGRGAHLITRDGTQVHIHPSSVNFPRMRNVAATGRAAWVLYHTKVQSSRIYLHDSTFISAFSLLLFGGTVSVQPSSDQKKTLMLMIDDWIAFKMPKEAAVLCKEFRNEINKLLLMKIEEPSADIQAQSQPVIQVVRKLLEVENS